MRFLADACCSRAIVAMLRADDVALLSVAQAENRIIVTEDFDFGDLVIREQRKAPGAVILFLPRLSPDGRAERLAHILSAKLLSLEGMLTIVEHRRIPQRPIPAP